MIASFGSRLVRFGLTISLFALAASWSGNTPSATSGFFPEASAVVGRPATPVSYAGVARRSTVGVGAAGVGARPGAGVNLGGPVNRVGVR